MKNNKKENALQNEELTKANGGIIAPTERHYYCFDCGTGFFEPRNNACPLCGSKNFKQRW